MRAALLPAFSSSGNQSSCCCHLGITTEAPHLPCSAEDVVNPTNSSFGSKAATLRLQRFYPSNCSSVTPYSSCWSGFKATVGGGTFKLTSTGASSCATGSGVFFGERSCH